MNDGAGISGSFSLVREGQPYARACGGGRRACVAAAATWGQTRHRVGVDGDVLTDPHIAVPQSAGHNFQPLAGTGILNPKKVIRQERAEATVYCFDACER